MSLCNHGLITNTMHVGLKFILAHHDETGLIMAEQTESQTTSAHEVDEFDTAQELVDQADIYGIDLPPEFYIKYMEAGQVFSAPVIAQLIIDVFALVLDGIDYRPYDLQDRMTALGLTP